MRALYVLLLILGLSWSALAHLAAPPPPFALNVIIQSALADLQGQMSMDGFQRLYAYVQLQKQYMKEVPLPAAMTAQHSSMSTHH